MKTIFLFAIPMSVCNFRCSYCYLAQRPVHYEGIHPPFEYTPEEVGRALSMERVGGVAFGNFCANGETLLTKNIDLYVKAFVEQGHYAEIVTNLTITPVINKILSWDKELLKRVEFKCSFHYVELKKKNLLDVFAKNVKAIWEAGASANIEITPADEMIPYIDEIKKFSMENFGALPHLTIARDDRTEGIQRLTALSEVEYKKIWGQFHSEFWEFKNKIFGKYQSDFCYAGMWSAYVDLTTGKMRQCYCGEELGNLFENPDKPISKRPIGKCGMAHCFNGHMMLAAGLVPQIAKRENARYGNLRNRIKADGSNWLQPELLDAFNGRVNEANLELSMFNQKMHIVRQDVLKKCTLGKRVLEKIKDIGKYNEKI